MKVDEKQNALVGEQHNSIRALIMNCPSSIKHGTILIKARANEKEHV